MFHGNGEYSIWGMHLLWWLVWIFILVWIFATPYNIPGERRIKNSPIDILKNRLAAGDIDKVDYEERKSLIEQDS